MKRRSHCGAVLRACVLALFACAPARADGLADLKAALARAATAGPLKAAIDVRSWHRLGEGKDAVDDNGQAALQIEDGARGLSVSYPKDVLARMDGELRARAVNPNTRAPTLAALGELSVANLQPMVSAAPGLQRSLLKAVFKSERADSHEGKPARLLNFEIPITTLSDRDRKYAKRIEATWDVWIGEGGMPLASRLRQKIWGRAFVVVSFESSLEEDCVYGMAGDRLLMLRREVRNSAAGAGERDEGKVIKTLQVVP